MVAKYHFCEQRQDRAVKKYQNRQPIFKVLKHLNFLILFQIVSIQTHIFFIASSFETFFFLSEKCLIDDSLALCLSTKYNNYYEYVHFVHFYPKLSLLICPLHGNLISCPYYHSLGIELFQFEFHQYVHLQYYCQWQSSPQIPTQDL